MIREVVEDEAWLKLLQTSFINKNIFTQCVRNSGLAYMVVEIFIEVNSAGKNLNQQESNT